MALIYSYVLRYDDGAAPNPFWGVCTLTICKPAIRRKAVVGDWVLGTGSKNAHCNDGQRHDLSGRLVYAMKVTDVLSLHAYDQHCQTQLPNKLPVSSHPDWRSRMGDCIYDFGNSHEPTIRQGVHNERNRATDLKGIHSLLSTHFYYFGEKAVQLPLFLQPLIKQSQGHKKIESIFLFQRFESWIQAFSLNTLSGEPQLKHVFNHPTSSHHLAACSDCHLQDNIDESEETVC